MGKKRGKGDNSLDVSKLRAIVERVEKLESEKADIGADIGEVFSEAKGNGFDTKAIKKLIKLRAMDAEQRQSDATMLGLYANALGIEIDPYS